MQRSQLQLIDLLTDDFAFAQAPTKPLAPLRALRLTASRRDSSWFNVAANYQQCCNEVFALRAAAIRQLGQRASWDSEAGDGAALAARMRRTAHLCARSGECARAAELLLLAHATEPAQLTQSEPWPKLLEVARREAAEWLRADAAAALMGSAGDGEVLSTASALLSAGAVEELTAPHPSGHPRASVRSRVEAVAALLVDGLPTPWPATAIEILSGLGEAPMHASDSGAALGGANRADGGDGTDEGGGAAAGVHHAPHALAAAVWVGSLISLLLSGRWESLRESARADQGDVCEDAAVSSIDRSLWGARLRTATPVLASQTDPPRKWDRATVLSQDGGSEEAGVFGDDEARDGMLSSMSMRRASSSGVREDDQIDSSGLVKVRTVRGVEQRLPMHCVLPIDNGGGVGALLREAAAAGHLWLVDALLRAVRLPRSRSHLLPSRDRVARARRALVHSSLGDKSPPRLVAPPECVAPSTTGSISPPECMRGPEYHWIDLTSRMHAWPQGVSAFEADELANTALHAASTSGHVEVCRRLERAGARRKGRNRRDKSAVHLAIECGRAAVRRLFEPSLSDRDFADEEAGSSSKLTALMHATRGGDLTAIASLLSEGVALEATSPSGCTALCLAAEEGFADAVEALLRAGANPNAAIQAAAEHERHTPLMLTAMGDHASAALALLHFGADACTSLEDGTSALMLAARYGAASVTAVLLESTEVCASIDHTIRRLVDGTPNKEAAVMRGFTPLFMACRFGHAAVVQQLVRARASLEAQTSVGFTPLQYACEFGQQEALAECIKLGANVNHRAGTDRWHALFDACMNGHDILICMLIEAGADVNVRRNNTKASALILAAQNGYTEAVHAMCTAGADVEIANKSDETALSSATKNGHLECMRTLLEFGASADGEGGHAAALGWASEKGSLDAVDLLLTHGASPAAQGRDGRTAIDRCRAGALDAARAAKVEELLRRYLPQNTMSTNNTSTCA